MSKGEREEANLLSESDDYRDDDQVTSQQDVYSEDGDHYEDGRPSSEVVERDYKILDEEDERERLLARGGGSGGFPLLFNGGDTSGDKVKIGKRERRKLKREARRDRKHGRPGEASELMYEMEEGGRRSESESSRNSSESDQQRLGAVLGQKTVSISGTVTWSLLRCKQVTSGPHVEAYHHTHRHCHPLHRHSSCSISGFQTLP